MKQLYIADPSKHKFIVKAANCPSTFSSMVGPVFSLLPGFHSRKNQTNNSKDVEDQKQVTQVTSKASGIETVNTVLSGKVQK